MNVMKKTVSVTELTFWWERQTADAYVAMETSACSLGSVALGGDTQSEGVGFGKL